MSSPTDSAPIGANLPEPKTPRAQATKPNTAALFRKNLLNMAAWYKAKDNGPTVGLHVSVEIVLRDVAAAFEAANAGKEWQPPT
jgi:hypothetical protein